MIACYKNEINVREGQEEKINWFQTSLVAQIVERLSTMWETQVRSLDREDPLEKEMAIHSSTPAWKNPMDGGASYTIVHGVAKSQTWLNDFIFFMLADTGITIANTYTVYIYILDIVKEVHTHNSPVR